MTEDNRKENIRAALVRRMARTGAAFDSVITPSSSRNPE